MLKQILLACLFSLSFTAPVLAADNPGTFGSSGTVPFISADTATDGTAATALGFKLNGTERMRVTETGHVGIGTASPSATLHVTSDFASVRVQSTSGGQAYARFDGTSGTIAFFGTSLNGGLATGITDGDTVIRAQGGKIHLATTSLPVISVTTNNNVGIGTTSPNATLEVDGTGTGVIAARNNNSAAGKYWLLGPNDSNNFVVYNQGYTGMYIQNGYSSWTANSDRRLKEDIKTYTVLDKIDNYRTVSFNWNSSRKHDIGVIAQELYQIFPEVVVKGDDDPSRKVSMGSNGAWGVSYDRLGALSMQGVKELYSLVKELKAKNDDLRARLDKLEARIK